MRITLRPITIDNWIECLGLKPTPEQQQAGFVATNELSLAQASMEPWWRPCAIYVSDSELHKQEMPGDAGSSSAPEIMVGFVMFGRWPESGVPAYHTEAKPGIDCILRFMIDGRYQGRGYGRAALQEVIKQIKTQPNTRAIHLSYEPENHVAEALYRSVGFVPTGHIVDGEIEAWLSIDES